MDHRQLEMFEAAVTLGSLTDAARQLGVTQPAVSTALGKLERDVGFNLFRREGRRLVPTAEARLLFGEAIRVLADFRRLREAAAGISAGRAGTLTIATNPVPAIAWLPPIAAAFCRERPNARLRVLTRSSSEVRELAALSAFDIGVAEAPFTQADILLRRYSLSRVVLLREGHPLAGERVLTPRLLDGQALIATVKSNWSWATIARAFEAAGAHCRVVAECEFLAVAIAMVEAGLGLCFADSMSAAGAVGRGLVMRPFAPALAYDVGLLRPAHGTLTKLAEAFAGVLHAHVSPHLIEDRDV